MLRLSRTIWRAELLSGVGIATEMRKRVRQETALLTRPPCLAVVLVGSRDDSLRYIKHKLIAAEQCGIRVELVTLPEDTTQARLHRALAEVNNNKGVDGVLLQLPLPPHLRARPALFHIHPGKDVDGLHPMNSGNMFIQDFSSVANAISEGSSSTDGPDNVDKLLFAADNGTFSMVARRAHERTYFIPCAALAVRTLLFSYLIRQSGFFQCAPQNNTPSPYFGGARCGGRELHAVIVNKSMVVGIPTAALLQKESNMTVTLCSRANSLERLQDLTLSADVLVTAYGKAKVFDRGFIKEGAIVIDVAINELPGKSGDGGVVSCTSGGVTTRSSKLCGDIDVDSIMDVAAAVTPTPGGVGPLTVAHLMQNVLKAYYLRHNHRAYFNNIYAAFLKMYGTDAVLVPGVSEKSVTAAMEKIQSENEDEEIEDDADNESYNV